MRDAEVRSASLTTRLCELRLPSRNGGAEPRPWEEPLVPDDLPYPPTCSGRGVVDDACAKSPVDGRPSWAPRSRRTRQLVARGLRG